MSPMFKNGTPHPAPGAAAAKAPTMTESAQPRPSRFRTGGLSPRKPTRFSYRPDAGEIRIDGVAMRFAHPRAAAMAGIAIIHQELSLLPHRSVTENIFMGHELRRPGFGGLLLDRARRSRPELVILAEWGNDG